MADDRSIEPKQGSPSFFKVVRYPSAPHLSLPVAFVKRYFDKIPKYPTLRTATGEHSWRLKIKKIGEDYCFAHGWEKLAQDVQLGVRDILVFWLIDPSTFQVSFFDEHGCEKDLPLNNTSDMDDDDENGEHDDAGEHNDDDDDVDDATLDEDLYFQKVISVRNHKYYMPLPKKFVDATGLRGKSSIQMRDNEDKEWKIAFRTEQYGNRPRLYLSSGWPLFRQYHDLCDGDMCLFKYNRKEGVLILAEMIKSKRPTKRQAPDVDGFKRKKRRPPLEKPDGRGGGGGGGGGGVKVKVEYVSGPEVELLKRKSGKPSVEKQCGGGGGGGVEVKIEDEVWPEVIVAKKKRRTPPLEKPHGGGGGPPVMKAGGSGGRGGGGVKVKIEDEVWPEVEVVKINRGGLPVVKAGGSGGRGGGGEVKTKPETERMIRHKQVIYF